MRSFYYMANQGLPGMFTGFRDDDGAVTVWYGLERIDVADSLAVANHSPTGFAWGFGGSGPAQLALAMLLKVTDRDTAEKYHQQFKWDWLAQLPAEQHWQMMIAEAREWLHLAMAEKR